MPVQARAHSDTSRIHSPRILWVLSLLLTHRTIHLVLIPIQTLTLAPLVTLERRRQLVSFRPPSQTAFPLQIVRIRLMRHFTTTSRSICCGMLLEIPHLVLPTLTRTQGAAPDSEEPEALRLRVVGRGMQLIHSTTVVSQVRA